MDLTQVAQKTQQQHAQRRQAQQQAQRQVQDPVKVAGAFRSVRLMPQETFIAALTVQPMRETCWL